MEAEHTALEHDYNLLKSGVQSDSSGINEIYNVEIRVSVNCCSCLIHASSILVLCALSVFTIYFLCGLKPSVSLTQVLAAMNLFTR